MRRVITVVIAASALLTAGGAAASSASASIVWNGTHSVTASSQAPGTHYYG